MMKKFTFRPRELKMACENEPWSHKAKIVGFSFLMCSIASYYQYYFDMLVYRANQFQAAALAGETGFDFMEYQDKINWGSEIWISRQTLDAWKDNSLKELKQINMNWKTEKYTNLGRDFYVNPNGNPYDNQGYYT